MKSDSSAYSLLLFHLKQNPDATLKKIFPQESVFWTIIGDSRFVDTLKAIFPTEEPTVDSEYFVDWIVIRLATTGLKNKELAEKAGLSEPRLSRFLSKQRDLNIPERLNLLSSLNSLIDEK